MWAAYVMYPSPYPGCRYKVRVSRVDPGGAGGRGGVGWVASLGASPCGVCGALTRTRHVYVRVLCVWRVGVVWCGTSCG